MSERRISTLSFARKHYAEKPGIAAALALPMVPDILDTIDANRGGKFLILAAAQVFKSLVGQLRLLRSMLVEPQPSLYYGPTDAWMEKFADEKLNPLFDATPPLAPLLFDDPHKRTKLRYSLPVGEYALFLSAGVEGNRQSKTACDIYFEEPWMFEPGWIDQIQNRREAYPHDFREIGMTTGPTARSETDQWWQSSDQRLWHCRCPACHRLFHPRFSHDAADGTRIGGLRYETKLLENGLPDEAAVTASTVYECPHCHTLLPDTDHSRLALNGTADRPTGLYVSANEHPAGRSYGWHVHHIALRPWGPLAIRAVRAQLARERGELTPLENLVRLRFADVWDTEKNFRTAKTRPTAAYHLGDEWALETTLNGTPARFCTIDVQQDYYVLVIRMWGRKSASRLRFCARPKSISEIRDILTIHKVSPNRTFLDSRYDSNRVRRLAALNGWSTLMGDKAARDYLHKSDGLRRLYDEEPKMLDVLAGTAEQGAGSTVLEWLFSKQGALDRLHLLTQETFVPDANLPDLAEPLFAAAEDAPEWYWKQRFAHYRQKKTNQDGSEYYVWHGLKDDHAADCEAMQVVVATMAGLTGAETLEEPKQ